MRINGTPKQTNLAFFRCLPSRRSGRHLTATLFLMFSLVALTMLLAGGGHASAAGPAVDLEQCRNGPSSLPNDCYAAGWVKGNAGSEQAHYAESYSMPYRAIMTGLPIDGPVTIKLVYKTKHSGKNAIDYLTGYERLEPHLSTYGHAAETVDPTDGISWATGPAGDNHDIPFPKRDAGRRIPCARRHWCGG